MASYPKSAYLLMIPPTQQDLSLGADAVFYLVGSPNRQWKIGPNRDWFIALQDEPRTTLQLAGVPTPQDIAQADYVDFFDSSDRTLKYRVKADGTGYTLYGGGGGGGGGGVSSYAALSDRATVNLPTLNTPLAAALSALQQAINNVSGGGSPSTTTPAAATTAGAVGTDTHFARGDHAHPITPAVYAGGIPQVLAAPTWDASQNVVTGTGVQLQDGVIPQIGGTSYYSFQVGVSGTATLGGISQWNAGDLIEIAIVNGSPVWTRNAGVPTGLGIPKTDGTGGLLLAAPGGDYAVAPISGTVDIIFPSAWTIGSGGAFTVNTAGGGTAFAVVHANCWMYFAAGACDTGSAAGFRFVQMSSTTQGTIFQNLYVPGGNLSTDANNWQIPANLVAWGATTPGTYALDTSYRPAFSKLIPQNYLGKNGWGRVEFGVRASSTAGGKNFHITLGGTFNVMWSGGISGTGNIWGYCGVIFANQNNPAKQIASPSPSSTPFFSGNSTPTYMSQDTSAAGGKMLAIELGCTTAADWVVLCPVFMTLSGGTL